MPFGTKPDPTGRPPIDFNRVYEKGIRPAIEAAGMISVRADEEKTGGIIHKPMFERLLLCEYAVADLTTANANVFYELGVRHTARPSTTQPIYAKHQPIPFDVNYLRAFGYDLGNNNEFSDSDAKALADALAQRLKDLRTVATGAAEPDSPLFQLLGEWKPGDISHLKTDMFHQQVATNEEWKSRMNRARSMKKAEGILELQRIEAELGSLDIHEAGIVIDLMLAYRALGDWRRMVDLSEKMPQFLRNQVLVREQLGFALNRLAGDETRPEPDRNADRDRALKILQGVEDQQGPNSETCGLIGRIHKDLWDQVRRTDARAARGHLKQAIEAYTRGFEADLRDAYPGINAATLLDIQGTDESKGKRDRLVPVVRFAVEQRLRTKAPDYWDYATMLELAVLGNDRDLADENLDSALAIANETWMPETTSRNLSLIREFRAGRGEDVSWLDEIISALNRKAGK
jgi:tetratricopeptide (TPR) repeat protein